VKRAFSVGSLLIILLACGEPAGRAPLEASALAITAETACRESAKALCARTFECSKLVGDLFFGSPAYCEVDVYTACAVRYEGPGATKTPASCAADAPAIACEAIKDMIHGYDTAPGTLLRYCPVTPGTYVDNDDCLADGDCQSTFCAHEPNRECGRCQKMPLEREPCGKDQRCPAPLRCDPSSRLCGRPRLIGDACGVGCANARCAPDGRCEAPATLGARCDNGPMCDRGLGFVCNEEKGKCEEFFVVGVGEPCHPGETDPIIEPGMRLCAGSHTRSHCSAGKCTPSRAYPTWSTLFQGVFLGCNVQADCVRGTCVNGHCSVACFP
jgi:hypothetical protein